MAKVIPIPTTEEKFFKQYIRLLNPLLNLRGKAQDVLAQIMYHDYLYRNLDEETRVMKVFHKTTTAKMKTSLGMKGPSFHNNLGELREKGMLDKDNSLKHPLVKNVRPEEKFDLLFSFKVGRRQS